MADYQSDADLVMEVPNFTEFAGFVNDDKLKRKILKVWAQRIRTFLLREFDKNSKGGGKWAPLKRPRREPKPARIDKRNAEQVAIGAHFANQAILVDTGALRMALNPREHKPGGLEAIRIEGDKATLSVGWGGNDLNPPSKRHKTKRSPHITISELAVIHHYGTQHIPARPLLVQPNEATMDALTKIAENEITKFIG